MTSLAVTSESPDKARNQNASSFLFLALVYFMLIIFLGARGLNLYAGNDSIQVKNPGKFIFKNEILPISLIGVGTALNFSNFKFYVKEKIGNTTNISIDDYIQFAPIAEMYLADLGGIKHRNCFWDQSKFLGISEVFTAVIVQSFKRVTNVERPNGGSLSFPSGHCGIAFSSAAVLFEEFKDENLFLALSGYGFATATAVLRITNNYHWIPDVLASAGIGILITHLIYIWEPLKSWKPLFIKKWCMLTPSLSVSNNYASIGLHIELK